MKLAGKADLTFGKGIGQSQRWRGSGSSERSEHIIEQQNKCLASGNAHCLLHETKHISSRVGHLNLHLFDALG